MKKTVLDSWKRPIEIEVEDYTPDRIPQQLDFNFGPREATPEEFEEKLFKEMMDSKIGKKNGEEATRNVCRAAALSAISGRISDIRDYT